MDKMISNWEGAFKKGSKNKSPGHSLPGDFQPKPYHNNKCDALILPY